MQKRGLIASALLIFLLLGTISPVLAQVTSGGYDTTPIAKIPTVDKTASAETRRELCKARVDTVDSIIYNCCIDGIEDYDTCNAKYGSGAEGSTTSQRSFVEEDSKEVYTSISACLKSGKTVDECWPIMQAEWTIWATAEAECRECSDKTCYTPEKGNYRIVGCDPQKLANGVKEIELAANAAIEDFNSAQEAKKEVKQAETTPKEETPKKENTVVRWFRNLFGKVFSKKVAA